MATKDKKEVLGLLRAKDRSGEIYLSFKNFLFLKDFAQPMLEIYLKNCNWLVFLSFFPLTNLDEGHFLM